MGAVARMLNSLPADHGQPGQTSDCVPDLIFLNI